MIRIDIYNILNSICPTYSIGQIQGAIKVDTLVLRRNTDLVSMNSGTGGWSNWSVDIYSPTSPLQVDKLSEKISIELKKNNFEILNLVEGDNYDKNYKAFFTILSFRAPKTL